MEIEPSCGLEYIVQNPEYTAKLGKALDCNNVTVKKQVFELLSALCVYNADGYARAIQALEHYKEFKGERYRLKFVVEELRSESNTIEYRSIVLAFINCLIISTPQLKERTKIRNEFIGLKLLPALNDLRRCVASYPDLGVQIDVFEEQRENDEAQILDIPYGVDLNSHVDVFYAILRQVADTPQEIPFLSILQHLLRIDPKEAISDIVWDTAETLVHRATLLESRQDATRILRSPSVQSRLCCHGHRSIPDAVCGSRKQSINIPTSPINTSAPPPPPPPPPLTNLGLPPPPPPPPPTLTSVSQPSTANVKTFSPTSSQIAAESNETAPTVDNKFSESSELSDLKLPQQETPTPKAKMKTINWNKIPNNKVIGRHNIWSVVARSHQHSPMADLDWSEMEGLFCQQTLLPSTSNQSSPKLGRDISESCERKRKEPSEIVLLDGKRSLNVNIFLKQFRCSNEDIIQIIRDGGHDDIGAEKLRGLLKMLPEIDELEMLRSFDGDKTKLGNAEKFLLQLIEVPNYKLRIESMLLKEEFASNMSYLEPSINSMIVAGEDLMTNKALQEVLYMVICAGNFLNSGGYAGNAAGVKLSSLQKLTDIRANKPGMNLIHYVALQVEKKKKHLMKFTEDMAVLEDAAKTTVEQLQNEINMLDSRVKKIKKQVELPSTETEIKEQTRDFLKMAETEVKTLQHDLLELESVRKSLADFFCEDPATFKIEDCFKIFHNFCIKFKQAIIENERRRVQEEQANARRRQREEQLAAKRKFVPTITTTIAGKIDTDCESIMNSLISDLENGSQKHFDRNIKIRRSGQNSSNSMLSDGTSSVTGSPVVMRRRLGSYSGDPTLANSPDETPDITPTGSLRRRRSRVPSEEDESSLMDFLRSSAGPGIDNSKDRKSWGSLDRSWARRARGGKRRPDLLTADFSDDRERPNSPSPLVENKPLLPTPEEETKPRLWRQKIEAWLQENEKEEKQSEDLRKKARRVQNSRRNIETDITDGDTSSRTGTEHSYRRVYSDWKPTIDKTDVVGVMEAIDDVQHESQLKDKSPWRKSNLNMANESEDDYRRLRRTRSRTANSDVASSPLEAIKEEDKRKGFIEKLSKTSNEDERLVVYFRRPTPTDQDEKYVIKTKSPLPMRKTPADSGATAVDLSKDEMTLPPFAPRRNKKVSPSDENDSRATAIASSDNKEIDADNIETPPLSRKIVPRKSNPCSRMKLNESKRIGVDDEEVLGDGQFERFSSARRTRRYRKGQEEEARKIDSTADDASAGRPTVLELDSCFKSEDRKLLSVAAQESSVDTGSATEPRKVDDKVVEKPPPPESEESKSGIAERKPVTKTNRIPVLKSNFVRGDKPYSTLPHSFKTAKVTPDNDSKTSTTTTTTTTAKLEKEDESSTERRALNSNDMYQQINAKSRTEHDLNDEGFEETQSFISDSPSLTTSSGYNYDMDTTPEHNETVATLPASSGAVGGSRIARPVAKRYPSLIRGTVTAASSASVQPSASVADNRRKPLHHQTSDDGHTSNGSSSAVKPVASKIPSVLKRTTSALDAYSGQKKPTGGLCSSTSPTIAESSKLKPDYTVAGPSGKSKDLLVQSRRNSKSSPTTTTTTPTVQSTILPRKVFLERHPSRSSLRSSRSSLNSCTSIGTVKDNTRGMMKNLTATGSSKSTAAKKPFAPIQLKARNENANILTCRNDGDAAVTAALRKPKPIPAILTTSFKENSEDFCCDNALIPALSGENGTIDQKYNAGTASFMRPTASSSAKDLNDGKLKLRRPRINLAEDRQYC